MVIEYANRTGEPRWTALPKTSWNYTIFGRTEPVPAPDEVIPMVFRSAKPGADGFENWTINGVLNGGPPRKLRKGARYRMVFDNRSSDAHPLHLHRETFELTNVHGVPTSGILKDVVLVKPNRKIAADFTPSLGGLMLIHCHMQPHMEHGFKWLFDVV